MAIWQPVIGMKRPGLDCHVLPAYEDCGTALGMLKGSAGGYLLKDGDPSVIHDALRAVAGGQTWVSQAISAQLVSWTREETATLGDTLTQREQKVLNLIVAGKSNLEIAQELSLANGLLQWRATALQHRLPDSSTCTSRISMLGQNRPGGLLR